MLLQSSLTTHNHNPRMWPFGPVEVNFCFLRCPLRWLINGSEKCNCWLSQVFLKGTVTVIEKNIGKGHVVSQFSLEGQMYTSWRTDYLEMLRDQMIRIHNKTSNSTDLHSPERNTKLRVTYMGRHEVLMPVLLLYPLSRDWPIQIKDLGEMNGKCFLYVCDSGYSLDCTQSLSYFRLDHWAVAFNYGATISNKLVSKIGGQDKTTHGHAISHMQTYHFLMPGSQIWPYKLQMNHFWQKCKLDLVGEKHIPCEIPRI